MGNLIDLARRLSADAVAGEKGDKGEKPPLDTPFSPLSPFFHSADQGEPVALTGSEPWDQRLAFRLMSEADTPLEHSGALGSHPDILRAADVVIAACQTCDMETLRFALVEFRVIVRDAAREVT